ncbi:hypothetical protein [Diaphorobacter ruginosibacter]|uniref:hypothetical protein n=1 Tax=Diaphorobacter ruginosibacter TaxID=1715720 RepID=UPI00333F0746
MKIRIPAFVAAALVAGFAGTPAMAADDAASAPAPAAQTGPSDAVQQALDKRVKNVLDSLEGIGTPLTASMFSAEFNKQAPAEQVQAALKQLHETVGSCKLAGRVKSPAPNATAYLLDCQKAFIPVEIAVEEKAPNRIESLLFRASFWRM